MGINYYLVPPGYDRKEGFACGYVEERFYHIGKSSAGWSFLMHISEKDGIRCFDDLMKKLDEEGSMVVDEDNMPIDKKDLITKMIKRDDYKSDGYGLMYGGDTRHPSHHISYTKGDFLLTIMSRNHKRLHNSLEEIPL